MIEKEEDILQDLGRNAYSVETTCGVCELMLDEMPTKNPTAEQALFAYRRVRILAQALADRLNEEATALKTVSKELEKIFIEREVNKDNGKV